MTILWNFLIGPKSANIEVSSSKVSIQNFQKNTKNKCFCHNKLWNLWVFSLLIYFGLWFCYWIWSDQLPSKKTTSVVGYGLKVLFGLFMSLARIISKVRVSYFFFKLCLWLLLLLFYFFADMGLWLIQRYYKEHLLY